MSTHADTVFRELTVDEALEGQRLDRALEALLPDSGLRHRRRLIEGGRVLVEGRPAPAGLKLRPGQRVSLLAPASSEVDEHVAPSLKVLARTKNFAAVDKPAGLHSAALAGGGGMSVEAQLPGLFPGCAPRLLNRLDRLTSGIVLVGLSDGAAEAFAAIPPARLTKEYLAVVRGDLREPLQLKRTLDTDDRKRTRVLGKLDPDPRGWTLVWPEAALADGQTLVRVRIQAGARHQIRAHLAAAFLPILGDPLYGDEADRDSDTLFLHHARLEFRGFSAASDPHWLAGLQRTTELLPGAAAPDAPDVDEK